MSVYCTDFPTSKGRKLGECNKFSPHVGWGFVERFQMLSHASYQHCSSTRSVPEATVFIKSSIRLHQPSIRENSDRNRQNTLQTCCKTWHENWHPNVDLHWTISSSSSSVEYGQSAVLYFKTNCIAKMNKPTQRRLNCNYSRSTQSHTMLHRLSVVRERVFFFILLSTWCIFTLTLYAHSRKESADGSGSRLCVHLRGEHERG